MSSAHRSMSMPREVCPQPFRPSLAELEALHALVATGKTTAAAHRLGVSQPAISRAVAALEARLGRPLFTREGGRLVATRHAYALDAEAAPILAAIGRLEAWPEAPRTAATLRIMAPPTLAHVFLAPLVSSFRQAEPETMIHVEIGRAPDTVYAVADGSADLGLVDMPAAHAGVRAEMLRCTTAHVLMPLGHALSGREVVTPLDLSEELLVAVTRRFSARARLEQAFADQGLRPRVALEAGTSEFVLAIVRAGIGLAVVNPFPLAAVIGADLVLRRFEPAIQHVTAFLLPAASEAGPAARRFVEFVRCQRPFLEAIGR